VPVYTPMTLNIRMWLAPLLLPLSGCAIFGGGGGDPPERPSDACAIFAEKDDWYPAARESEKRWGVPIALQMAFMKQESGFDADAQPPRRKFLGLIPTTRPSSAYGYSQALDSTWEGYIRDTGNRGADRDDFEDAIDFIGWYCTVSHKKLGIAKNDAYNQYLAYHEGQGGYSRRTYERKDWLLKVARKVEAQTLRYNEQLARCGAKLEERDDGWW
jgi:hypothetical protein